MTAPVSRRTLLGAAWSVPVIALAVAAPASAASTITPPLVPAVCADPKAGTFVVQGRVLVIKYKSVPDIYEVNVHFTNGASMSFGSNFGTGPTRGATQWTIGLPAEPAWVQVHGFDTHFGEPTCEVPVPAIVRAP